MTNTATNEAAQEAKAQTIAFNWAIYEILDKAEKADGLMRALEENYFATSAEIIESSETQRRCFSSNYAVMQTLISVIHDITFELAEAVSEINGYRVHSVTKIERAEV